MRSLIIVVAIAVVGGGAYWMWGPTADESPTQNQDSIVTPNPADEQAEPNEPVANEEQVITDNAELEALFASGSSVRCDYESSVEGTVHSGTIYHNPSNDGYRISSVSTMEGDTFETDMIMRDRTLYTWGSSPMGEMAYQMDLSEDSSPTELLEGNLEMPATADDTPEADNSVRYECVQADLSADLFELPDDIEFTPMGGGMMPAGSM